jgi:hypothetical protein
VDKEKKQQIILIILIPVFLIGLIYMRSQQGQGEGAGSMPQQQVIEQDESIDAMPGPKTDFNSEYIPASEDPFKNLFELHLYRARKVKPKEKLAVPLPVLTIEGIIWNTHMPQAIVNGQVVKIGDVIEGVTIVNIEKQGITVDHSGEIALIRR